jgi:peptidoglycan/LPS O-acetylase OafA/YrhL
LDALLDGVTPMNRGIPSLDGLRAVSIGFVLVAHLSGTRGFPQINLPGLGEFGVRVFFVISGYLITSLLLKERARTGTIRLPTFYFRRLMRLSPALLFYLIVIFTLSALGAITLRPGDVLHALTYTMNFHFDRAWQVGHLWSLSVEEQFYLLWPAALLFSGSRARNVCFSVIAMVPLIRIFLLFFDRSLIIHSDELFFTIADTLAAGCALAFIQQALWRNAWYTRFQKSPVFWFVPLAALAINFDPIWRLQALVGFTVMNICIALTIDQAVRMPTTTWGKLLNLKPMRTLGVISYSLYLWQQLFLNRASDNLLYAFPANLVFALLMAGTSYVLVESPALRLREKWEAPNVLATKTA